MYVIGEVGRVERRSALVIVVYWFESYCVTIVKFEIFAGVQSVCDQVTMADTRTDRLVVTVSKSRLYGTI